MSELPQKLRAHSNAFNAMSNADWMEIADASLKDAADRIEQLEAALRKYACGCSGRKCDPDRYPCGEDARAALGEKP